MLEGADPTLAESLAGRFAQVIDHESLLKGDAETKRICREWELLSTEMFQAYQRVAFAELDYATPPESFSKLVRKYRREVRKKLPPNSLPVTTLSPELEK
jgi:hypothetical protein